MSVARRERRERRKEERRRERERKERGEQQQQQQQQEEEEEEEEEEVDLPPLSSAPASLARVGFSSKLLFLCVLLHGEYCTVWVYMA